LSPSRNGCALVWLGAVLAMTAVMAKKVNIGERDVKREDDIAMEGEGEVV
jgi:hypothetical protein